jgi:hypothetical protein
MFLLADEMFKQRNKTITVTIGKSIEYSLFDHSKTPNQWSEYVKERVYEME